MSDSIQRLYEGVQAALTGDPETSRTTRLLQGDRGKIAKKVGEEAIEVSLDAIIGNRQAVIEESADLIYNLVVLWTTMNIAPADVWAEMDRREQMMGIAEKLPKAKSPAGFACK